MITDTDISVLPIWALSADISYRPIPISKITGGGFWGIDINVFMGDLLATFKDTALFFACKRTMSEMKSCISGILKRVGRPHSKLLVVCPCSFAFWLSVFFFKVRIGYPDRWEVGPYFAHHLAPSTPLHPYVTLHLEMLLFHFLPIWTLQPHILVVCKKCAKEVHTSRHADEANKERV